MALKQFLLPDMTFSRRNVIMSKHTASAVFDAFVFDSLSVKRKDEFYMV